MKTIINISGQISGNTTLLNAIQDSNCEAHKTMFNGYRLTFNTRKDAYKALWTAYKYLVSNEPEFKRGIKYSKKYSLYYDASSATIVSND